MRRHIIPVTLLGVALGCGGEAPGAPDLTPDFGVAGGSGCYTVVGALDQVGSGPNVLSGVISGDVEGTVVSVGGPTEVKGGVLMRSVTQTWEITGGIIEPLIGHTLHLDNDLVATTAQAPLLGVNTVARVVDGARMGNLTYHGVTNAFPSVTSHLEYHGVICP